MHPDFIGYRRLTRNLRRISKDSNLKKLRSDSGAANGDCNATMPALENPSHPDALWLHWLQSGDLSRAVYAVWSE